ncbi:hypothetical protein MW887_001623 [Aspergillus wentii]|nr:hypothetical protein MW887_001623 [Aspergillus wentii]
MAPNNTSSTDAKSPTNRNVEHVVLGDLLFKTWYQSIYPEELVSKDTDRLYVCRWCFRYSCDVDLYAKHTRSCENQATPLGTKVYDHGGYSVWEVDGEDHKLFAQNLSLFAKLFVDHKSVFFDVATFLFYILTFTDPEDPVNYYILGYFSKEKLSWDANNLACILIFPPYQHKQLGKLLMGVSYKLSDWEREGGLIGGPEKPLSEMGHKSYVRFWEERMSRHLLRPSPDSNSDEPGQQKQRTPKGSRKRAPFTCMTVQDIGLATGMLTEDVITALKGMEVIESDSGNKKRKSSGETSNGDGPTVTIWKSNVLEWAKDHRVTLQDPVREEGFLGKIASNNIDEGDEDDEGQDTESPEEDE